MKTITKNKRLIIILAAVPLLLLIPFIGMQISAEINWSLFDFLLMGVILLVAGLFLELVLRNMRGKENRIAVVAIIFIVFLLIWAELAVGILGTPFAGS